MPDSSIAMRAPARWMAVLRMVVGVWFFKSILSKVTIGLAFGFLPVPMSNARWLETMPMLIERYAAANPFQWYKSFLLDTVVPNAHTFANLSAVGEVGVGFLLLAGLFTPVGAVLALVQVMFYGLAVQHQSPGQLGFHVMLFAMIVAFFFARAGRVWGLDAVLRARKPESGAIRALT